MKYTHKSEFRPGQAVTIVALERSGYVELVRFDEAGTADYHVTWWDEGKRCAEWLPAREIKG